MLKEDLLIQLKDLFSAKAKSYGLSLAFLYGSWARGIPKPDSDVDLAVCFSAKTLSDDQLFEKISQLELELTATIKKEVSIIAILPDFRKPMLYYNAIVLGKPVYIESTDAYARFFVEAIYQMEDFGMFGTRWQRTAAARNLAEINKHD